MRLSRFSGHIFLLAVGVGCVIFTSCHGGETVWTKSVNLPESKWNRENKLVFEPDTEKLIMDNARRLVLFVRYRADASLKTLPLIVETESSVEGFEYTLDSVWMRLFDDRGVPLGAGNYGVYEKADTFELTYPIIEGWNLTAAPALAEEETDGIISFGISLLK